MESEDKKYMFYEMKVKYENSKKEKKDKIEYWEDVHSHLMNIADLNLVLKESNVDRIVIDKNGIYEELDTGIKLFINEDDYMEVPMTCLCGKSYEPEETEMVCRILNYFRNDEHFTVLDIGANVGWYSLNIMNKYPLMQVYSVEPSPVTYGRLKKNFELNGISTEKLTNLGFYKENGKIDFYYDAEDSGASSLVNLREKEEIKKNSIAVVKLDEWMNSTEIEKIDFIKCDVEGSEYFVYQGGAKTIEKCRPIIFSEMLRKWCAKFDYHPNDIIAFLGGLGYGCFVISGNKLAQIDEVTETTIETNYFFLHKEKYKELIKGLTD